MNNQSKIIHIFLILIFSIISFYSLFTFITNDIYLIVLHYLFDKNIKGSVKKLSNRKHVINFVMTFVIGIAFLFLGLTITFFYTRLMPGDPTAAYLPINATIEQREAVIRYLGLDQPLIIQYFRFIGNFLTGNWGLSSSISKGQAVVALIGDRFPRTSEILILPLLIAAIIGYLFGRVSNRTKRNWLKMGIQVLSAVCIAVPIFGFGMFLQYTLAYQVDLFPATGYKSPGYPDPPFITGFRLLDSLMSGQLYLAFDTILHYTLPWIILTMLFTALITRVLSSKMAEDIYKKKTILSNAAKTSAIFGVLIISLFLIDLTFNLRGITNLLLTAISHYDYYAIQGLIFVVIILFVLTIIVSNLIFSIITLVKDKKGRFVEVEKIAEREAEPTMVIDLKNYSKKLVRSPLTIIGVVAVLIPIILSLFAELISGYTYTEASGIYPGAWNPPSPDHLLGTGDFGRDVLARSLYGTGGALLFGIGAVFVGLVGGLHLGGLAQLHRVVRVIIMSFTLVFYILPGILIILLLVGIMGPSPGLLMITTGLLLIPSFTRIVANAEFRVIPIGKKILAYIPLFMGFSILFYASLGFLGFTNPFTIQLGMDISEARAFMYVAPWAIIWPGLAIFLIVVSLFILHEGLAKHSR
ncbi:MAG: ABC transporter permease subunit [Candidatus Lokiarchaeota archaeon]|nr:ABC transporter permease subunit [Candidatus Lokiarchaeota archaeon]